MSIRDTVIRCATNNYNRKDVDRLIRLCYNYAFSFLKMKASSRKHYIIRNENIEDLAWDFIADLFQKDKLGNLVVIQGYFANKNLSGLRDSDVKIELRKLVFSKVDDNIFRYYGEKDPSLRKIIRNIKLALRDQEYIYRVSCRNGFLIVEEDGEQTNAAMPADFMRIRLCSRLKEQMQIPEIVDEVIDILRRQDQYRSRFSLVALASVIRHCFVILEEGNRPDVIDSKADKKMLNKDFDEFLDDSAARVKETIGIKYVQKGKLEDEHLELYFRAASDIVSSNFREQEGGMSQYDKLKEYLHDLDYEQYRSKHRPVLEYIVKRIRQDVVNSFRKDWAHF